MNYRDFFKEDLMPGGKGDKTDVSKIDPKQLEMGIKVEMEHTKDEKLAREITIDHLTEDPHYYSKLKSAGLADELKECGCGCEEPPTIAVKQAVLEPETSKVDTQTTLGTVYPKVEEDPSKQADMMGGIGSTSDIESNYKTDVESPAKDPLPTDHITGGMSTTPVNPNILPKDGCGKPQISNVIKSIIPKDIAIDVAESKKILKKMKEGMVPAAGDPDTDKKFVKGKRWTVKWD